MRRGTKQEEIEMYKIIFTAENETLLLCTCRKQDLSKRVETLKLLWDAHNVTVNEENKTVTLRRH